MTPEEIKWRFEEWLSKGIGKSDEKRRLILNVAEQKLPWFIRENINEDFDSIYEITDPSIINQLWHTIKTKENLKNLNNELKELNYTEVLRLYEDFLHKCESESHKFEEPERLKEGALQEKHLTYHERNPQLRRICIEIYGWKCIACGFDFQEKYGDLGKEYIEVHHLFPISQTEGEHNVDPEKDLVPLCANCHAMIHRLKDKEMTVKALKKCLNLTP